MNKKSLRTVLLIITALFGVFVYCYGLGSYGLMDPDEGRYSEIPREMIESGDFVTPKLNYVKYFEKPVLHYWLTAGAFVVFGQNEFASRFFPVLLGIGGCVITFLLAKKITRDENASALAGLILGSSILWYAISRINITDMTLTFFFTAALYFYRLWLENDKRFSIVLFYVAMSLAVLTKGLIGVVLPGGIALLNLIFTKQYKRIPGLFSPLAIIIFFLIVSPYFIAVCQANDDFFYFFFVREHFLRYTTTIHERYEPMWFFVPIILAGFIPWSGTLIDAARAAFGKCNLISRDDGHFLGLWFLLPFIFFSVSKSKLIPYIMPCMPPVAVLGAAALSTFEGKDFKRFIITSGILIIPVALTGLILPAIKNDPDYNAMIIPAASLSIMLLIFFGLSVILLNKKKVFSLTLLCIVAFAALQAASGAFKVEADHISSKDSAEIINTLNAEDVVVYQNLMQGMGFYLKQRTITAETLNELEFGAMQEKDSRWFINNSKLAELWKSPRRVVVFMRKGHLQSLTELLGVAPVRQWTVNFNTIISNF